MECGLQNPKLTVNHTLLLVCATERTGLEYESDFPKPKSKFKFSKKLDMDYVTDFFLASYIVHVQFF
jgi:hypothetical protein